MLVEKKNTFLRKLYILAQNEKSKKIKIKLRAERLDEAG